MTSVLRLALAATLALGLAAAAPAAGPADDLAVGTVELKSAGPLCFGPEGILFVGDPQAGCVYAIDTADRSPGTETGPVSVPKVNEKLASAVNTPPADLQIADMAVNPVSGKVYFSVARGRGPTAPASILRLDRTGAVSELPLKDVRCGKAVLPNANDKQRQMAITCLGFANNKLIVAGLSNEEFASTLRFIPFPFKDEVDKGTAVEIFHGAHGKYETRAPVRTFVTYNIDGQPNVLGAYTCTPLVKFPVSELKPGQKVRGTTVAELGNMNVPLDMIVYSRGGQNYLLVANSARGVMKIPLKGIESANGITTHVTGGKQAGLPAEAVESLKGVVQLAQLDRDNALVLVKTPEGSFNLETVPLP